MFFEAAKMMSTFTAGTADGTLVPMWTEEDETKYKGIKMESSVYGNTSDMVRGQDRWKQVYQLFGLRHDWDWKINGYPVAPAFDDSAYVDDTTSGNYYNDINRPLQRVTRLPKPFTAKGVYAGNIQYMEPQVFATPLFPPLPPNTTLPSGKSVIRGDLTASLGGNVSPFSVTMADIAPAIEINAGIPHIMGANHYDPTTDGDSSQIPIYDWKTILATLCIETDVRPAVKVDLGQKSPWLRTLLIEVPHAEFWWLTTGTITYQNNDLSLNLAGGFATRDDTEILRRVAALAKAWYGVTRTPMSWTEKCYLAEYAIGMMIKNASAAIGNWMPINTVITAINYDFLAVTTHIQTGFGELDSSIVLDIPGMSDFASVGRAFNRQTAAIQEIRGRVASIPPKANAQATGVVMGQLTAISEEDGTFTVDLYESGTDNDATSTQTATGIYPEVTGSKPEIGAWGGAIIGAAGKKYMMMAATSATGINASFFCDLFDRNNVGSMNGYWGGTLGAWTVDTGAAVPVTSNALIASSISGTDKEYNIGFIIGIEDKSVADSNGYIASTLKRTLTLRFGLEAILRVIVTTWQSANPTNAILISNEIEKRDSAKKIAKKNAIDYILSLLSPSAVIKTQNNSGDYNSAQEARLNPYISEDMQLPVGDSNIPNYWMLYSIVRVRSNGASVTDYFQSFSGSISLAQKTEYQRIIDTGIADADAAYNQAVSNLAQATYIDLSITDGSTVASVTNQILKDPNTQEFNLNVAVSGTTITVTAGDSVSVTYDNIAVNRICSAVSVSGIANKHWLKSIKVWKKDQTEPTQTGYGSYRADGFTLYKDKYHVAIKDDKGVITGYTYAPNA